MVASYIRKLARASEHLTDVKTTIKDYLAGNPYSIDEERQPEETLRRVWTITLTAPVPLAIAPIAGDCLHNLRSVLDHWVDQFSVAKAGKAVQNAGFPILSNKERWDPPAGGEADSGSHLIRKLPDPVKAIIELYQPFNMDGTWRDPIRDALRALHKLDIRDKHQALNVMAINVNRGFFGWYGDMPSPLIEFILSEPVEFDTPTTFLVLRFASRDDLQIDMTPHPIMEVILAEKAANRRAVIDALEAYINAVSWMVGQMDWARQTARA